jgi:integrase
LQGKPPTPTLRRWLRQWLDQTRPGLRVTTHLHYEELARLLPHPLLDMKLDELTGPRISSALAGMLADGRGSSRVAKAAWLLRRCLDAAVALGLLDETPMRRVTPPRHRQRQREYWTVDQAKAFLAVALGGRYRWGGLFALLLLTGLRVSEGLGLEWRDVDLDGRRLLVRRAIVQYNHKSYDQPPKSRAARRWVVLPEPAVQVLRLQQPGEGGVFRLAGGKLPDGGNLRRDLRRVCAAAKVPATTPHGLRHVHAMVALEATGDAYAVQRRLGHSHVSTTVAIYGYSHRGDDKAAGAIDALLAGD